jgi:50S ribosomal protein L16 3-hydroxylase
MSRKHLRGIDPERFMKRTWQREPLLVRKAFPAFDDPLSPAEVMALAGREEAQARLVVRRGAGWTVEHGPFPRRRWAKLPPRGWTVLVQDTNHFSARADRLLASFDFIPHARVDDVMVSLAAPGGGVGPHVDSYDVFLLQGRGRRRWRISRQKDHAFVPGLDLRILERFEPEAEWVLEAGDMLYLPPGVAHDGIAESECLTWSIGFRAPGDAELVQGFLDFLRDRLEPGGRYADPGSRAAVRPGEIPPAMVEHALRVAGSIRWSGAMVREFVGRHLSEPKAHVFFEPPARPLPPARFAALARARGIALDPKSRVLFSGTMFFVNGEPLAVPVAARAALRRLANRRRLDAPVEAPAAFWRIAHDWYARGFATLPGGRP